MNAMDVAVAMTKQGHGALGTVMEALQRLLADVAALRAETDIALFSADDDLLFGDIRREEFRKLYFHIRNLLPRKMRMSTHHPHHEQ